MTPVDVNGPPSPMAETHSATPRLDAEAAIAVENGKGDAPPSKGIKTRFGRRTCNTLADFYHRNPGEELSVADAAQKLGLSERTARNYLSTLVGDGILERVSVYRLKAKETS